MVFWYEIQGEWRPRHLITTPGHLEGVVVHGWRGKRHLIIVFRYIFHLNSKLSNTFASAGGIHLSFSCLRCVKANYDHLPRIKSSRRWLCESDFLWIWRGRIKVDLNGRALNFGATKDNGHAIHILNGRCESNSVRLFQTIHGQEDGLNIPGLLPKTLHYQTSLTCFTDIDWNGDGFASLGGFWLAN